MAKKLSKKDVKTITVLLVMFFCLYLGTFLYMGESLFSYDHFRNALISKNIAEGGEMTLIGAAYYKHTFLFFIILAIPYLIFKTFASQTYFMILISLVTLAFNYTFFKKNFSRKIALFTTLSLGFYSLYLYYSLRVMHEVFILLAALVALSLFHKANQKDTLGAWAIAGLASGLALLIKPPLGLMFPAVGFYMIVIYGNDFKRFFEDIANGQGEKFFANRFVNLFVSFFIALAVYAPWHFFTKVNNSTFSWLKEFRMEYAWMQGRDPDSLMRFLQMFAESLGPSFVGIILAVILSVLLLVGLGVVVTRMHKDHKYRDLEVLFVFFTLFIVLLQSVWPIKEFRFFFPIFPMFLYFVYVGIMRSAKYLKDKMSSSEADIRKYLVIVVVAIFVVSSFNFILAKDYTTSNNLKDVQLYAVENGLADKNWASDQRMSAAYYLDQDIIHLVNINAQIVSLISNNIEYIAVKTTTAVSAELFTHVADVRDFKIYKVEQEVIKGALGSQNQEVTGTILLDGKVPGKKVYFSLSLAGNNQNQHLYQGATNDDGSFSVFVPKELGVVQVVVTAYSWGYEMQNARIIPGQENTISLEKGSSFKHGVPISGF